jgi:hypothetical protein
MPERPLFPGYSAAWEPPTCSYLPCQEAHQCVLAQDFLRTAAHEGVLRRRIHSELPLFIGSLSVARLILFSFNAGQTCISLSLIKIPAEWRKVNLALSMCNLHNIYHLAFLVSERNPDFCHAFGVVFLLSAGDVVQIA